MKLKRTRLAFLVMVFILSGCMSDVSMNVTLNDTKQADTTALRQQPQLVSKKYMGQNGMAVISAKVKQNTVSAEIQDYAISKNLSSKMIQKESIGDTLKQIVEKSDAKQYEPPKVAKKVAYQPTISNTVTNVSSASQGAGGGFAARTTLYGVDCVGCSVDGNGTGGTAAGVNLNPALGVVQSNGAWAPGITYDGYYIIATDRSIPFFSIVEISNHGYSGMGFSPDKPILAIVLDRGGGVSGNHIDLYIGSETFINQVGMNGSQPTAKILRYGR